MVAVGVGKWGGKAREGAQGSPSSSPLTSLRVSSGGTLQMGLRARCRYSIMVAVGEKRGQ